STPTPCPYTTLFRSKAEEYIFGYTCANDVSNRVLQARDGQNTRAKSFDTFKPLGPAIATELDPSDLSVCCRVNGEIRQDGWTSRSEEHTSELQSREN